MACHGVESRGARHYLDARFSASWGEVVLMGVMASSWPAPESAVGGRR